MKTVKILIAAVILITYMAVGSGCKKESSTLSGTKWYVSIHFTNNTSFSNYFTFNADKTWTNDNTNLVVANSSWSESGNSISFSGREANGSATILSLTGTINGRSMGGTVSDTDGKTGTFSGTQQ